MLFKYITELTYKTFRNITLHFRQMTINEIIIILERIGCSLNVFKFWGGYAITQKDVYNFLKALHKHCTHLHTLEMYYLMMDETCYQYININNLKKLSLENCDVNDYKLSQALENKKNTNLTELSLQGNVLFRGDSLLKLTNLKFLNLKMCPITNNTLIDILKSNSHITSLNLTYCGDLNFETLLKQIPKLLPNLIQLYLDNCIIRNYHPIAECKNLKVLSINYYLGTPVTFLDDFLYLLLKNSIKLNVLNVHNHNLSPLGENYLKQILK